VKGRRGLASGFEHCKGLECRTDHQDSPCTCSCVECVHCDAFQDGIEAARHGELPEPKVCAHDIRGTEGGITCTRCDLAHGPVELAAAGYVYAHESRASELADELGMMAKELEEADRKYGETARRLARALRDLEHSKRTSPTPNPHTHLKRHE
jgi:hypothetical protein